MRIKKILPKSVPSPFVGEFIAKVYYLNPLIERISLEPLERCVVEIELREGHSASVDIIEHGVDGVLASVVAKNMDFEPKVHASRVSSVKSSATSPMEELVRRGEVHEFGPGRVGLGPLLVQLEDRIEQDLLSMSERLGAKRHSFPTVIGADVLHKCRYLQSFPQFVTLASHLCEDMDVINRFSREVSLMDSEIVVPAQTLAAPKTVLSPTVCFHFFAWLQNKELDGPRCVTAMGHCHRYEAKTMSGLERLWDFRMREIVYAGNSAAVERWRADCLEMCVNLLNSWDITYEIVSATDPFYVDGYGSVASYQAAFELKYEIRVPLPYSPGRSMAIGSINRHHDFFGNAMGFTEKGFEGHAHTACVGFGLERVAWAWLCTHGLDAGKWPK